MFRDIISSIEFISIPRTVRTEQTCVRASDAGFPRGFERIAPIIRVYARMHAHAQVLHTFAMQGTEPRGSVARRLSLMAGKFSADLIGGISAGQPPRGRLVRNFL